MKRRNNATFAKYAPYGALLTLGLLTVLLSGCQGTIVGHWRMVKVVPNKEAFCIDDAAFERNGIFTATTTIEGKTTRESGTYKYTGFKLTLRPSAGGQRIYNALVKLGKLEITRGQCKVILKKGQ
ncbi:MAG: lipocalin family protein [Planctomycetota bacterium]